MSNFKELLFMENDDWMKVTAKIEYYEKVIRIYSRSDDMEKRKSVGLYSMHLARQYDRRSEIEKEILDQYNLRAMASRGSLESTDDNFVVDQIIKNGFINGFKF